MELLIFIVGIAVLAISVGISAHLQKRIDKLESIMNAELAMARDSLYLAKKQISEHEHEHEDCTSSILHNDSHRDLANQLKDHKMVLSNKHKQLIDVDSLARQLEKHGHKDKDIELSGHLIPSNFFDAEIVNLKKAHKASRSLYDDLDKRIEKLESGSLDVIDKDKTYSRREVEDYLNINQYQRTKLVKDGLLTEHRKVPKWPDLSEYYYDGQDIETYAKQKERKEAVK